MLAPTVRRLLLDALSPPEGWHLDHAIGTTYTLDLVALLRVPLAATAMPWASASGGPVQNPFALLAALRSNASRISLFCHAGMAKVPPKHIPLLAYLEDAVHPVSPPTFGGVFHPKLWLLRFAPDDAADPVRYRLLVLSRNLTFDRSWDTALCLDGELLGRQRGLTINRPLAGFVAALPSMAAAAGQPLKEAPADRIALLADEVRKVVWELPDGFDDLSFHPIGHDGRSSWPITDLHRLMVLSPFVGAGALTRLRSQVRSDMRFVGRFDEVARLDAETLADLASVDVFDDPSRLLDTSEDDAATGDADELSGLHAKVYVGERQRRAVVYVGSANATEAAFDRNVEFLVELGGQRRDHGIDAVRGLLEDAGLLLPFTAGDIVVQDEGAAALERRLERVAHELACGALRARVDPVANDRWRVALVWSAPVEIGDIQVEARPLSEPLLRRVELHAEPSCVFPPAALTSITPFFALRLSGRVNGVERSIDTTARLPLDGAPEGRAEAVTNNLLSDRERLVRFILLLLASDGDVDRMLGELEGLLTGGGVPGTGGSAIPGLGIPLLEPLLRALHRTPEKLDDVERLLSDLVAAGGSPETLLPPEVSGLLVTISAARDRS